MANITQNANKQSVKYPHTPTKCVANNPLGVGADSSCPYPDINKKRVSVSLNTHIHIIKYTHSFHHTRIFFPHFVGVFIYAGAINRSPTAADGLPKHCERIAISLLTDCDNILNKLQQHNIQKTKTILLQCKNLLLALQKPPFCTPKTILLLTIYKLVHYQRVTRYYPFG